MALAAARAGGDVVRAAHPRRGDPAALKGAGDYVTATDRQSEEAILEVLARGAPGVPVLAEERGGASSSHMWAVDPLDGTTNFIRGLPVVGVSVALLDGGMPVLGAVLAPLLGLEFTGVLGQGATLNEAALAPLGRGHPGSSVVATGFPFRHKERLDRYLPVMEGALLRFEDLRRAGAASLDLAWTAAGSLDGFFELGLSTWDIAAGALLVTELGGRVSDWRGGDSWIESGDILSGTPEVHGALLELAQRSGATGTPT